MLDKVLSQKRVLLLTQEEGRLEDGRVVGNASCAYLSRGLEERGYKVEQLTISKCEIVDGKVYYNDAQGNKQEVNFGLYGGIIRRAWDGKTNSHRSVAILEIAEQQGLYPLNPSSAAKITLDKTRQQEILEASAVPMPKSFTLDSLEDIDNKLAQLQRIHEKKGLPDSSPVFVLKNKNGTGGSGIEFYKLSESDALRGAVNIITQNGGTCVLQEYIKPQLITAVENPCNSAHWRILMVRDGRNPEKYNVIGGIYFQREGSWVSNSSSAVGKLSTAAKFDVPEDIISSLSKVAHSMGLNQFGADVMGNVILELNDSPGLSGKFLEQQEVAKKCAQAFAAAMQKKQLEQPRTLSKL